MRALFTAIFSVMFVVGYAGLGYSGTYEGDYEVGSAANGIGFSRHNLGRYGDAVRTETTFQICIYCHTPHTPLKEKGPLWTGKAGASTSYTAYGTNAPVSNNPGAKPSTTGLGSPSLACLSCHDGATAFDSIANSPGKRKVPEVETPGAWGCTVTDKKTSAPTVNTRLVLAPTLTDDHPVNVFFRGGKVASLRLRKTIISQINLKTGLDFDGAVPNRVLFSNLWSIKGYISDTATIGDLLRDGRIECSSCHDPHFNNKSWDEISGTFKNWDDADGLFLRRVGGNYASSVCRTCHGK